MATDVAASLPDIDLPPGCTITVTLDDASAKITQLNVYGYSPGRASDSEVESVPTQPLFAYGPVVG